MRYIIYTVIFTLLAFQKTWAVPNSVPRKDLWICNGRVYAMARQGDTIFVGGGFDRISSTITGESLSCQNLAAFSARTGRPYNWFPNVDDTVRSLAVGKGRLFIGGDFLEVNRRDRFRLAAFDISTGALLNWVPAANHEVWALSIWQDTLFVGGKFTQISGSIARYLGVVQISTGRVRPYGNFYPDNFVVALAVHNDRLYIGGNFTKIGSQERKRLAVINLRNNQLNQEWNFTIENGIPRAFAFSSDNSRVYIGGDFTQFGPFPCSGLIAVNTITFQPITWVGQSFNNVQVYSLAFAQDRLIVGGKFKSIGEVTVQNLALIDTALSRNNVYGWNPAPNEAVYAILPTNNKDRFFIGGAFSRLRTDDDRSGIAEFNDCDLRATIEVRSACQNSTATIAAIPFGGTGIYQYTWLPNLGLSNPQGRITSVNREVGKYAYTLLLQDSQGCTFVHTDSVEFWPLPQVQIPSIPTLCRNQSVQLSIDARGSAPFGYRWEPSLELDDPTLASPKVTPTSSRTYTVYVTDRRGCTSTAQVSIRVYRAFASAGNNTSICEGDTLRLQAAPAQSYLWQPSVGLSDSRAQAPLAFPRTTTTYILRAKIGECEDVDSIIIAVRPSPLIRVFFPRDVFCVGQSQQIVGLNEPDITYRWFPTTGLSNPSSPTTLLNIMQAGEYRYILRAQNKEGCSSQEVYNFTVLANPEVNLSANRLTICRGDTVFLRAQTNAPFYQWIRGE
ncbi:MAG: hypothetical protein RML72_03530, partial [Bacteroidia bacterium]|nr:hypothetical protein [Bacteroidia bacterium]MDW8157934.1 hypothetical protein [Bacteroidia bacterium]